MNTVTINCDCQERGFRVTGPHSHACEICGEKAYWGFYTRPRCLEHRTEEPAHPCNDAEHGADA